MTAETEERRLTLYEHLEELRERLIKSLIALAIATAIAFLFTNSIFEILKSRAAGIELIRTEMTEMIGAYFKVALISGVILSLPVLLYQGTMFVAPALTPKEKRYFFLLLPGFIGSFILGVAFAFFVLLPPALNFLLAFGSDIAKPQIKVGNYVETVSTLMFWVGVAFETPLLIYFLAVIRVVSPRQLSGYRRYAIVLAFLVGAIITPTFDPVNQTLVALPIVVLYEIGILLARFAWRGRPKPT